MANDTKVFRSALEQFSVPRQALLVVHSAIGILSRQGFRANDIIETLLDHVQDGGLFMPAMTWRTVTPDQPYWDEIATPSHTGVLSEIFRTQYAVARSIHPTHSVAGWGASAKTLLSRHQVDSTPVSDNSPYGLMRDYEAFVLLIGVGLETCTAIHLPEEIINQDLYVLPPGTMESYVCRDRLGVIHQVQTRRHRKLDRDFPKFAMPLLKKSMLKQGEIASCPYTIVRLSDLLREVFTALIDNPKATLKAG